MDRHGIGRKMEREAMHYAWANYGWKGLWQPPRGKFAGQDVWSVFDYLAINAFGIIVGVQVCQDRRCWVEARRKAILDFMAQEKPLMLGVVMAYKRNKDGSVTWTLY
jgi:hypothetical protein